MVRVWCTAGVLSRVTKSLVTTGVSTGQNWGPRRSCGDRACSAADVLLPCCRSDKEQDDWLTGSELVVVVLKQASLCLFLSSCTSLQWDILKDAGQGRYWNYCHYVSPLPYCSRPFLKLQGRTGTETTIIMSPLPNCSGPFLKMQGRVGTETTIIMSLLCLTAVVHS